MGLWIAANGLHALTSLGVNARSWFAASLPRLTQENKVAKAAAQAEAKGKQAEVKTLEAALLNYKEAPARVVRQRRKGPGCS